MMIKYRAKRTDNDEMVEGWPKPQWTPVGEEPERMEIIDDRNVVFANDGCTIVSDVFQVNPDTLEVQIGDTWMKPEAVERLKRQRDGLLAVLKDLENNGDLDSFDMDFVREAIAEAEAHNERD